MKLISNYRDYYDPILHQMDHETVFIRKTEPEDSTILNCPPRRESMQTIYIGFCGKTYKALGIWDDLYTGPKSVLYNEISSDQDKIRSDYTIKSRWGGIFNRHDVSSDMYEGVVNEHQELYSEYFSFVTVPRKGTIIYPNLNDLQFYKIFNCYTAAQEVMMWIDNKANPEPDVDIPTGDNIVLRDSKGFDEYSFKKQSSGKSKRLNKKSKCN